MFKNAMSYALIPWVYFGFNFGYITGDSRVKRTKVDDPVVLQDNSNLSGNGGIVGVLLGIRHIFQSGYVLGAEIKLDRASLLGKMHAKTLVNIQFKPCPHFV